MLLDLRGGFLGFRDLVGDILSVWHVFRSTFFVTMGVDRSIGGFLQPVIFIQKCRG